LILRRLEGKPSGVMFRPWIWLASTLCSAIMKKLCLLESALEQHNGRLLFIHQYHEFDPLRDSPAFYAHLAGGRSPGRPIAWA